MRSIPSVVEEIVESSPFLGHALNTGIINLSSLARFIKPEIEESLAKKIEIGAIVMALKRLGNQYEIKDLAAKEVLKNNRGLLVRSKLIEFTYQNSENFIQAYQNFLNGAKLEKDSFFTLTQGVFESTLIVNSSLKSIVERFFLNEKLISCIANLSSISIRLPEENTRVPGIYYLLLKEIALKNLNIIEMVSTTNEVIFFCDESEMDKIFYVLNKLLKI